MVAFVPDSFSPPTGLDHPQFRLRPLGPEHNESDYIAWTTSIDHVRSTPGFEGETWPSPMSIDENLGDLVRHASDFAERIGFTYTVLHPDVDTVIGCVYIYPTDEEGFDARCRSWVRSADADLDIILWQTVTDWLVDAFPFTSVKYAGRSGG